MIKILVKNQHRSGSIQKVTIMCFSEKDETLMILKDKLEKEERARQEEAGLFIIIEYKYEVLDVDDVNTCLEKLNNGVYDKDFNY